MNCFCGMVDRGKAFSLISSLDHCQILTIANSDMLQAGFDPVQNRSSGLLEWSCAVALRIVKCVFQFRNSSITRLRYLALLFGCILCLLILKFIFLVIVFWGDLNMTVLVLIFRAILFALSHSTIFLRSKFILWFIFLKDWCL